MFHGLPGNEIKFRKLSKGRIWQLPVYINSYTGPKTRLIKIK